MKKNLSIVFMLFLACFSLLYSCSSNDKDDVKEPDFIYNGEWSGTYTGDGDSGSFNVKVTKEGNITGNAFSTKFKENYSVQGNVSKTGAFSATVGDASTGATFNGQCNEKTATGTWTNTYLGMSGAWTARKN